MKTFLEKKKGEASGTTDTASDIVEYTMKMEAHADCTTADIVEVIKVNFLEDLNTENVSKEDLKNPDYVPPLQVGVILGLQHVLAMFVSNVTPSIIIAGVAGFAFGSADTVFLIQMSMLFAGIATLMQTIGFGPVGARLPVMQGTSFAFVPVMVGAAKMGMGSLFGGIVIGGLFHAFMGLFIGKIRHWFPPLVSGLVILVRQCNSLTSLFPLAFKSIVFMVSSFQDSTSNRLIVAI